MATQTNVGGSVKNIGRRLLAATALFLVAFSGSAAAQPSPCNNLQVRISNGIQVIDAPVTANCAFSQGGLTGVYTVYSHVTGQPLTPNSPYYSLAANTQRIIFGCLVPSTKADKTWDVLPNEVKCSAPVSKPLTLAVTKTASQNPLVTGKAGQSYAITIAVSNGPTTAPTLINDTLPSGITTSGPVTASAGTLSGCPTSGAANLAGCILAAGLASGSYTVTVPISVSNTATSGTNSASISSQGATCPNNPGNVACTASTGNVGIAAAPIVISDVQSATVSALNTAALVTRLFTISVTVSGLAAGTNVVLRNNGTDNLAVNANGAATFSNGVAGAYAVSVFTQPTMAFCTVTNAAGTATANVANVQVACGRFAIVPKTSTTNYAVTACVKDMVTGLIWEGKTASGARAGGNQYTHYDDVNHSQYYTGSFPFVKPTTAQVAAPTNTIGYQNMVNGSGLCGSGAWRLPTIAELSALRAASLGIGSSGAAAWLPNAANFYWSASPAWAAESALMLYWNSGVVGDLVRANAQNVRLVR